MAITRQQWEVALKRIKILRKVMYFFFAFPTIFMALFCLAGYPGPAVIFLIICIMYRLGIREIDKKITHCEAELIAA